MSPAGGIIKRSKITEKYKRRLNDYLRWIPNNSNFLRPKNVKEDPLGPSPEQIMIDWESQGCYSVSSSDPIRLSLYMQGKICRDWHIKEWKEGCEKGLFLEEEFLGTLGCDESSFAGIFGREPNMEIVKLLQG
jgi:hypothetical protein